MYEKRRSFTESLVFLVRRWGKKMPWHRIFRGKIGRLFKCPMTGVFTMIFDQYSPAQNEGGQLNGGQAWYRTQFYLEEDASLVSVRLLFDGVYMNPKSISTGKCWAIIPMATHLFLMISRLI